MFLKQSSKKKSAIHFFAIIIFSTSWKSAQFCYQFVELFLMKANTQFLLLGQIIMSNAVYAKLKAWPLSLLFQLLSVNGIHVFFFNYQRFLYWKQHFAEVGGNWLIVPKINEIFAQPNQSNFITIPKIIKENFFFKKNLIYVKQSVKKVFENLFLLSKR